jgi:hypothetical protein
MKAAVVFVFSLAVLSCSYRPGDDGSGSNPLSSPTAKDLWEAETIALYLSGEMLAPPDLAQQVLEELASIRSAFGDARPEIRDIRFWPPWRPGSVILYFDEATKGSVASGTYSPWDELNQRYGLTRLDLTFLEDNSFVILFFGDPLHPRRLEEKYALLPGVSRTNPFNESPLSGHNSSLFPGQVEQQNVYLFNRTWNDGIDHHYMYFTVDQGQPVFTGEWLRLGSCLSDQDDNSCPEYYQEPPWWEEAHQIRSQYSSL